MATAKQWAETEGKLPNNIPALRWSMSCCILELRARVEALEADGPAVSCDREPASVAAQPTPAGSLVERVAIAITPTSQTLNREWARAAIREVAAWFGDRATPGTPQWIAAAELTDEAER